jgi:nucleoside-diphosphate-sugar epimerase
MEERIGVLGCGWLGLGLAQSYVADDFVVHGSRQSKKDADSLQKYGVHGFAIQISENHVSGNLSEFLHGISRLFLIFPPGIRKNPNRNFVAVIHQLLPHIHKSKVKEVVFTSSTGVYGPEQGIVTPNTAPQPHTESGRQLLEVESILRSQNGFSTQIVRLGGLLGGDRHPVKQLAKLPMVYNPEAPINLIHKSDAIGLVRFLADQAPWQNIYNGVAPWHPTKQEFYEQAAKEMQLPSPKFAEEPGNANKIVTDPQLESLGYSFFEPKLGLDQNPS